MARYVPKTYNNRRGLRIIIGAITAIALSVVILFLILFLILQGYVVDGRLEIPWLLDETATAPPPVTDTAQPATPPPVEETAPAEPAEDIVNGDDPAEDTAPEDTATGDDSAEDTPPEDTATGDELIQ